MKYFDSHTHPHFHAFTHDYRETIQRGLDAGVGMILVGTQKDTSRRSVEVAHEFEGESVYAAVGLHPVHTGKSYHDEQELGLPQTDAGKFPRESASSQHKSVPAGFISRSEEFDYEYYKTLAQDPKVVAIGECGLDYYRIMNNELGIMERELKEKQRTAFERQIELAIEVGKPLMIHCRDAFSDLIQILKPSAKSGSASGGKTYNLKPSVVHFFTGTVEDARALLDLGFSFTFGGVVTFPPKKGKPMGDYDEVVKFIPLDRILSETDAPYVSPVPYRGKRNEPAYVVEVVKKLAEFKGVSTDEMAAQIHENAKRIFGIS